MLGGNAGNHPRPLSGGPDRGHAPGNHSSVEETSQRQRVSHHPLSARSSSVGGSTWSNSVSRMQSEHNLAEVRRLLEAEKAKNAQQQRDACEMRHRFEEQIEGIRQEMNGAVVRAESSSATLQQKLEVAEARAQTAEHEAHDLRTTVQMLERETQRLHESLSELSQKVSTQEQRNGDLQDQLHCSETARKECMAQLSELSEAHAHRASLVRELLATLRETGDSVGAATVAAGRVLRGQPAHRPDVRGDSVSRDFDVVEF